MRNMLKATTLERKFPLLAVENGCIISKDADITVAFRVELPELFTVTSAEYEAIHSAWYKAIKVLPDYSIVHKQDFFITENYQPDTGRDELSFLSRSFERHFNERPFLNHYCYLFLTKTTRERSRRQSDFSTLCRGRIVPQEIADRETAMKFIEAVGQFERIMNDSGFITLTRLAVPEITELLKVSLLLGWAYAESLYDVKTLLEGGKIPLIKDDATWHFGLQGALEANISNENFREETGLSYEDYLRIFLMLTDTDKLTGRAMNLVEADIRLTAGNADFRLDGCFDRIEAYICVESTYGYQFELTRQKSY